MLKNKKLSRHDQGHSCTDLQTAAVVIDVLAVQGGLGLGGAFGVGEFDQDCLDDDPVDDDLLVNDDAKNLKRKNRERMNRRQRKRP